MCTSYLHLIKHLCNTVHSESLWNPSSACPDGVQWIFIKVGGLLMAECTLSQEKHLTQSLLWAIFRISLGGRSVSGLLEVLGCGWVGNSKCFTPEELRVSWPCFLCTSCWRSIRAGFLSRAVLDILCSGSELRVAEWWEHLWKAVPAGDSRQWNQMPYNGQDHCGTAHFDCILSSMAETSMHSVSCA